MKNQKPVDVSDVNLDILNVALDMSLEWGENWLEPIQTRIQQKFPNINPKTADQIYFWCIEVREYAFDLVEKEYPLAIANEPTIAIEKVKRKYPQISEANLSRLFNQGMYYAWHG